jgi:FkbM family methyltransferase
MNYIFDFGANKGQNLGYFLSRADRVVAIEAVPAFCKDIETRFNKEISTGRLKVVNAFACDDMVEQNKDILFFQSVNRPGESTFIRRDQGSEWIELTIPSISAAKLILSNINKGDKILYVKIDVEGADVLVINALRSANLVPDYLSVEIHDKRVVDSVLEWSVFNHVQIVEAGHPNTGILSRFYLGFIDLISLKSCNKRKMFFSPISSGPFGSELPKKWMPVTRTVDICGWFGLGARDLHFTIIPPSRVVKRIPLSYFVKKHKRVLNTNINNVRISLARFLKSLLGEEMYAKIRQRVFYFRRMLPSVIRKKILLKKFRKY